MKNVNFGLILLAIIIAAVLSVVFLPNTGRCHHYAKLVEDEINAKV